MNKERAFRSAAFTSVLLGAVVSFVGCESKGPAEQAGSNIDKGIQNAKDAVTPAGPVEKAGRTVDKALNK